MFKIKLKIFNNYQYRILNRSNKNKKNFNIFRKLINEINLMSNNKKHFKKKFIIHLKDLMQNNIYKN